MRIILTCLTLFLLISMTSIAQEQGLKNQSKFSLYNKEVVIAKMLFNERYSVTDDNGYYTLQPKVYVLSWKIFWYLDQKKLFDPKSIVKLFIKKPDLIKIYGLYDREKICVQ